MRPVVAMLFVVGLGVGQLARTCPARASAADVFGLGSAESAVGGASSARVSDFSAAFYNPAGLSSVKAAEASVGVLGYGSALQINGRPQGITEPFGVLVGAAAPVPFGAFLRDRLYVGIALFILPDAVVRVIAHPPDEPFFPYYDNRTQRLLILPSLAVRIGWGFSVGVAFNYLAGLGGQVSATEGATRAVEPRVDEAIFATVRVNAGLRWSSPKDRFAAAFVYRQHFSVPFTTNTSNNVAGQPLDISIDAEGLYTPDELVLGGAFRPLPWLLLSTDLTAALWSAFRGPYVTVQSDLPLVGTISAPPPVLTYRDAYGVRLGAEADRKLNAQLSLAVRAGYGYESSPIPDSQPGVTNLLDGAKHFLSAGVGLVIAGKPPAATENTAQPGETEAQSSVKSSAASDARPDSMWDAPATKHATSQLHIRIDLHGQVQIVEQRTLTKQIAPAGTAPNPATALRDESPDTPGIQISNPGYPSISGGGAVWSAGLTLTVQR